MLIQFDNVSINDQVLDESMQILRGHFFYVAISNFYFVSRCTVVDAHDQVVYFPNSHSFSKIIPTVE